MDKKTVKMYDVTEGRDLPEQSLSEVPADGDPIEIDGDLYFVCERDEEGEKPLIGVIPLMVKDPARVANIGQYVRCLSMAHRKVRFMNEKGDTDLEHSNEMVVS